MVLSYGRGEQAAAPNPCSPPCLGHLGRSGESLCCAALQLSAMLENTTALAQRDKPPHYGAYIVCLEGEN